MHPGSVTTPTQHERTTRSSTWNSLFPCVIQPSAPPKVFDRGSGFPIPTLISSPPSYNHWDQRPCIVTLQQVLMGVRNFSSPPFPRVRKSSPSPSILQRPLSQLLVLHFAALLCDRRSSPPRVPPPLASFLVVISPYLAVSRVVLQGAAKVDTYAVHPLPPRAYSRRQSVHLSNPHATKTQREATQGSPPRVKLKPTTLSDDSSQPPFSLTPSQSPGPTRPLSELLIDHRIFQEGCQVEISTNLLPFEGEVHFSLAEIYSQLYDTKSVKTRWRPTNKPIVPTAGQGFVTLLPPVLITNQHTFASSLKMNA